MGREYMQFVPWTIERHKIMYLGNSRMTLGKKTNDEGIGDWLAVAPSTAIGGTYGIAGSSVGYCSEIFNGYLYVGGAIASVINGTTTTTNANNLIKYNLTDQENATWVPAVNENTGIVFSIRSIGNGDHLLASGEYLNYITGTSSLTANSVTSNSNFSGISNTFTSININGTSYPSVGSNNRCIIGGIFDDGFAVYDGEEKTITQVSFNNLAISYDCYVTDAIGGKGLFAVTFNPSGPGAILASQSGFTEFYIADEDGGDNVPNTSVYHQTMISIPAYKNKIYVVDGINNNLYTFNYSSDEFIIPSPLTGLTPYTLNTVVYNNINYLILGGISPINATEKGLLLVNPTDPDSVQKRLNMPIVGSSQVTIYSISVDSDSTIYVTGQFEFVDKNGVTAKNIAKFVPSPSKILS
jgi:hypothetical protein